MDTTTIIQSVPDQYQIMLNNYATIVEKTNQQLGLWTNPYGIMIGLLTIFIAVVAIVVSFLLWKNSSDQKKRAEEFFSGQEKNIKAKTEAFDCMLKERGEFLNNLIQEYQDKLKNVNKENKEEIKRLEQTIDELNKNRAFLGSYKIPEVVEDITSIYNIGLGNPINIMTCFGCGKKFQYKDKTATSTGLISSLMGKNKKVYCPHCGAENFV